jgi:hypothetical protein
MASAHRRRKVAVGQLLELKRWQFTLDNAVAKCQTQISTDRFCQSIQGRRGYRSHRTTRRRAQKSTLESLTKARDHQRTMEQWDGEAQRFSRSATANGRISPATSVSGAGHVRILEEARERGEGLRGPGERHRPSQGGGGRQDAQGQDSAAGPPQFDHDSTCVGVPAAGFCMAVYGG